MLTRDQILTLAALASLFSAIVYGIATYQTPYGCVSSNIGVTLPMPPQGPGLDLQVLTEPCAYVYIVGIVSGSILLILLIPTNQEKHNETLQNTKELKA